MSKEKPKAEEFLQTAEKTVKEGLGAVSDAATPEKKGKNTSPEHEAVSDLQEGASKGISAAVKGVKKLAKQADKEHSKQGIRPKREEISSTQEADSPRIRHEQETSFGQSNDKTIHKKEDSLFARPQKSPADAEKTEREWVPPSHQAVPPRNGGASPAPGFSSSEDLPVLAGAEELHTADDSMDRGPKIICAKTGEVLPETSSEIFNAEIQESQNFSLKDSPSQEPVFDRQRMSSASYGDSSPWRPTPDRPSGGSPASSGNSQQARSGNSRFSIQRQHVDDKTIKTDQDSPISTREGDPKAQGLCNEPSPLASSFSDGSHSINAIRYSAAAETAGETAGQAGVQAIGEAGASAGAGAATGGATVAAEAAKKIADKIKETVQTSVQSFRENGSGVKGAAVLLFIPLLFVFMVAGSINGRGTASNQNLSNDVLALMPQITAACQKYGISEYVPVIAAVMMQESGGNVELVNGDVMMCAEAMGYPVFTPVPVDQSIDYGTHLLANLLHSAGAQGPDDLQAISLAIQSYNFGPGFLNWAQSRGGYSKENAARFASEMAALLGWSSYGDEEYVDHVFRYYVIDDFGFIAGDSAIENGFFAYPYPSHRWSTYGGHAGVDIAWAGCYGQPIYAAADGIVSYIQMGRQNNQGSSGNESYGNFVKVNHSNGWSSIYAHMSAVAVAPGEEVMQGQLLGYIGDSGNAYGAHLHLELKDPSGNSRNGSQNWSEVAWPQHRG